jgi:hypothetical protein
MLLNIAALRFALDTFTVTFFLIIFWKVFNKKQPGDFGINLGMLVHISLGIYRRDACIYNCYNKVSVISHVAFFAQIMQQI